MNTQILEGDDVPIDSSDSDCLVEKANGHRLVVETVRERDRVPHGSRPLIQRLFGYLIEALPHAGKVSPVAVHRGSHTNQLASSCGSVARCAYPHSVHRATKPKTSF
jgi:hypothetical protein